MQQNTNKPSATARCRNNPSNQPAFVRLSRSYNPYLLLYVTRNLKSHIPHNPPSPYLSSFPFQGIHHTHQNTPQMQSPVPVPLSNLSPVHRRSVPPPQKNQAFPSLSSPLNKANQKNLQIDRFKLFFFTIPSSSELSPPPPTHTHIPKT